MRDKDAMGTFVAPSPRCFRHASSGHLSGVIACRHSSHLFHVHMRSEKSPAIEHTHRATAEDSNISWLVKLLAVISLRSPPSQIPNGLPFAKSQFQPGIEIVFVAEPHETMDENQWDARYSI